MGPGKHDLLAACMECRLRRAGKKPLLTTVNTMGLRQWDNQKHEYYDQRCSRY